MSSDASHALIVSLGIAVLCALVVAAVSLVALIVRWRSPKRRVYGKRLVFSLAATACLIGLIVATLNLAFWPALRREQMAEIGLDRASRLAESSFVNVGDAAPLFSLMDTDAAVSENGTTLRCQSHEAFGQLNNFSW